MKNFLLCLAFATGSFALAACADDRPPTVVRETRVVHHYHTESRPKASDNPSDFEPVERPASYSR